MTTEQKIQRSILKRWVRSKARPFIFMVAPLVFISFIWSMTSFENMWALGAFFLSMVLLCFVPIFLLPTDNNSKVITWAAKIKKITPEEMLANAQKRINSCSKYLETAEQEKKKDIKRIRRKYHQEMQDAVNEREKEWDDAISEEKTLREEYETYLKSLS